MARSPVSPIDVIEASYDLALDARAWLRRIAETVRPLIEGGRGAYAYYYDVHVPPERWLDDAILLDCPASELQAAATLVQADRRPMIEEIHVHPEPLESALQAARRAGFGDIGQRGPYATFLRATGAADYIAFRTIEPEGRGIAISAGQRRARSLDRRTQQLWARVAAHVASALRMRDALQPVEAVLTPKGRVEHAEGAALPRAARETLRSAVLRQERARGKLRREDPQAATELWTALVSGRWSIVDRFEESGRRYLVARPNEHALRDPRALSLRERVIVQLAVLGKSNKLIAYELGITASTVSTHLKSAMRKLGVKTRLELGRLARELQSASS